VRQRVRIGAFWGFFCTKQGAHPRLLLIFCSQWKKSAIFFVSFKEKNYFCGIES